MYRKKNTVLSAEAGLNSYVEGFDVYNSKFLHLIADPTLDREAYVITTHEFRPDLISADFYNDTDPFWVSLVVIQSGREVTDLTKGTVLYLLPKDTVQLLKESL